MNDLTKKLKDTVPALALFAVGIEKATAQCNYGTDYDPIEQQGFNLLASTSYTALFGPDVYQAKPGQINLDARYNFDNGEVTPFVNAGINIPAYGSARTDSVFNSKSTALAIPYIGAGMSVMQGPNGGLLFNLKEAFVVAKKGGATNIVGVPSAEIQLYWKLNSTNSEGDPRKIQPWLGFKLGMEFKNAQLSEKDPGKSPGYAGITLGINFGR